MNYSLLLAVVFTAGFLLSAPGKLPAQSYPSTHTICTANQDEPNHPVTSGYFNFVYLSEDAVCNENPYVLVFEDNFEGNAIDKKKWNVDLAVQSDFAFHDGKAWGMEENVTVSNGTLKCIAKKLDPPVNHDFWCGNNVPTCNSTFNYSNGGITSKFGFGYGKYEIRCRIPSGTGLWPAFWGYGEEHVNVFGLDMTINNECDVFEFPNGDPHKIYMTQHYSGSVCGEIYDSYDNLSNDFHIYALTWDKFKIQWFLDGVLLRSLYRYYCFQDDGQFCGPAECYQLQALHSYLWNPNVPTHEIPIAIKVGIGVGNGTFHPDNSTPITSYLIVDYIKYYKQIPCNEDLIFSTNSSLNLNQNLYNVIVGKTVELNGNISIPIEQQIKIIASEQINVKSNVELGGNSDLEINPAICPLARMAGHEGIKSNSEDEQEKNALLLSNKEDIFVDLYPIPNSKTLNIEIRSGNFIAGDFDQYFLNSLGQNILPVESIAFSKSQIDISSYPKGIYFLIILNKINYKMYSKKIVIN